jgi:site-specific recombinase XerD
MDIDQNAQTPPARPAAELLIPFEVHLRQLKGLQASSTGRYVAHVSEFFTWRAGNDQTTPIVSLTPLDLRREVDEYLKWCYRKGNANTTRLAKLMAIQNYIRYLVYDQQIAKDPTTEIPRPPTDEAQMTTFNRPEVLSMFRAIDISTEKGIRDVVFLVLGVFAGFRVSEITKFNLEDVIDDGDDIDLLIRGTRKKRGRTIWIWKAAGHFIRTLLLARLSQGANTGDPLLVSYKKNGAPRGNRRLSRDACNDILRTLADRAGLRKYPIKPHMLRATHANDLQRIRGYAMPQIMERLGWKHLSTVERYLVRRERIHKVYNNLHEYWIEFTKLWTKGVDTENTEH